jgi:hypothetical protein
MVIPIFLIPVAMIANVVFEDLIEKRRRAREREIAAKP